MPYISNFGKAQIKQMTTERLQTLLKSAEGLAKHPNKEIADHYTYVAEYVAEEIKSR